MWVFQNLSQINDELHTFFVYLPVLESRGNIKAKLLEFKRLTYKYSYLMHKKQLYAAPATEVLELLLEGTVLTGSDTLNVKFGASSDDRLDNVEESW